MSRLSTIFLNGSIIQLHRYADVEFVIIDGVLVKYNGNAKDVVVPTTVNEIYLQSFAGASIESITIPDSVKKIGARAFEDCRQLASVVLPESIDTLENGTFLRCWNLTDIHLPQNLNSIYARYSDDKNIKYILSKMDKLAKPLKNKKADKENKIMLMNLRGAFMLNANPLAQDYFEKLGLTEQYLNVQNKQTESLNKLQFD